MVWLIELRRMWSGAAPRASAQDRTGLWIWPDEGPVARKNKATGSPSLTTPKKLSGHSGSMCHRFFGNVELRQGVTTARLCSNDHRRGSLYQCRLIRESAAGEVALFAATRSPRVRRCCAQEADNGGRRAATRGRPWLLCGSAADAKSNSHAAGRLRVADVYWAAGGREMMRRSVLGIGGSEATDEPQRMIEPDAGAARAEAPRAKELCQKRTNVQPPSAARRLYIGRTLYVASRSGAK